MTQRREPHTCEVLAETGQCPHEDVDLFNLLAMLGHRSPEVARRPLMTKVTGPHLHFEVGVLATTEGRP